MCRYLPQLIVYFHHAGGWGSFSIKHLFKCSIVNDFSPLFQAVGYLNIFSLNYFFRVRFSHFVISFYKIKRQIGNVEPIHECKKKVVTNTTFSMSQAWDCKETKLVLDGNQTQSSTVLSYKGGCRSYIRQAHVAHVLHSARISNVKASFVLIKRKTVNVELGHILGSYVTYVLHTARI